LLIKSQIAYIHCVRKNDAVGFQQATCKYLASVNIYLRYFHRLYDKWGYKSYPPHLPFVSTLPCEIYGFILETEKSHENSSSV